MAGALAVVYPVVGIAFAALANPSVSNRSRPDPNAPAQPV